MRLVFKSIKISNFLSIGEANVNLNGNGYTLINGINLNPDDLAKSNGSGKSTLFEAITWCLTGETIRGSNDVVNIHGNDGALVELDFDADGIEYKLIRTKDHSKYKNNLKIFINGEDKSGKGIRDSVKLLAEYLPDLTSSLLGSVIILGQGLPQKFTNNTPAGRKEVLEKLSKSDFMIEDLKNRLSNRKTELNAALRFTEDNVLKHESTTNLLRTQINTNKAVLENLSSTEYLDVCIKDAEEKCIQIETEIKALEASVEEKRTEYKSLMTSKETLNSKIASLNEEKIKLESKIVELNAQKNSDWAEIKSKWEPSIREHIDNCKEANTKREAKKAELNKLTNITDTCPTCGQKLPGVFKPDTTELENEIQILTELIADEKKLELAAQEQFEAEYNAIVPVYATKVNDVQAEINMKLASIQTITNTELRDLNNTLAQCEEEGIRLNRNIETYRTEIRTLQNRITAFITEKSSLDNKKQAALQIIEDNTKQIEELEQTILTLRQEELDLNKHLEIINKMSTVITRDFRGYLLINIIDFINRKSKEYALDVFETDKIDFRLDGNNISIIYDEKDYNCLSGGEKQKVDIIVQFAIRDMLCKYLGFSSNILVLDEICDNVDSVGAEKLFNMISRKLSDVQNIFIISHHAGDLQIPYDRQITVIKDATKISRIEESM